MTDPPRPDFLELADYTGVLRRRGWIALALAGLGGLVSVVYLAVAPASYQATADVYVTPNSANQNVVLGSKGTSTAVNMDNEAQIVESNTVAVLAARTLHSRMPAQALLGQVSVSVPANTAVLAISCSAPSPGSAAACWQNRRTPHDHHDHHLEGAAQAVPGSPLDRLRALRRYARDRGFDIALSHASHELPMIARSLGIPSSYAFDYEFARVQHGFGCRAANRVVVPEAIPQDRLDGLGARSAKVRRYPGLKEEYYLHGFVPDDRVPDELGISGDHTLVVVRTPPDVSLYHREANPLFGDVLERLGRDPAARAVVLPRTAEQRAEIVGRELPSVVVPEHAVDAQSLVALSDLVVSAGGTMNREAVALGTPVWTTFAGRLGAVDEQLIEDGRLRVLADPDGLALDRRPERELPPMRDPAVMLDLMLTALAG